jgi:hypothetical protein
VCGGLAGDPFGAALLAGLGVTELSMTPRDIPAVKARIRASAMGDLQALAARAGRRDRRRCARPEFRRAVMTTPKRVATVTFNPAIDQTITVDHLTRGEVHRARAVRQDPGGKGVNVASCLADWGVTVTVFGLLGADNAAPFEALCAAKPIIDRFERLPGSTRVNIKIVDGDETTDINMDGLSVDDVTAFGRCRGFAGPDALVVLSGSVPPGCHADIYAGMVARLRATGTRHAGHQRRA